MKLEIEPICSVNIVVDVAIILIICSHDDDDDDFVIDILMTRNSVIFLMISASVNRITYQN